MFILLVFVLILVQCSSLLTMFMLVVFLMSVLGNQETLELTLTIQFKATVCIRCWSNILNLHQQFIKLKQRKWLLSRSFGYPGLITHSIDTILLLRLFFSFCFDWEERQRPRILSKILRSASYFQVSSWCLDITMKHCLSCLIYQIPQFNSFNHDGYHDKIIFLFKVTWRANILFHQDNNPQLTIFLFYSSYFYFYSSQLFIWYNSMFIVGA